MASLLRNWDLVFGLVYKVKFFRIKLNFFWWLFFVGNPKIWILGKPEVENRATKFWAKFFYSIFEIYVKNADFFVKCNFWFFDFKWSKSGTENDKITISRLIFRSLKVEKLINAFYKKVSIFYLDFKNSSCTPRKARWSRKPEGPSWPDGLGSQAGPGLPGKPSIPSLPWSPFCPTGPGGPKRPSRP